VAYLTPDEVMDRLHTNPAPLSVRLVKSVATKPPTSANISTKRDGMLKRIGDMEAEIGRLSRLARELRADLLELTTE
jgi:hypothetical protein